MGHTPLIIIREAGKMREEEGRESLTNARSFECLRRELLVLIGDKVNTEWKLHWGCSFLSHIKDADL